MHIQNELLLAASVFVFFGGLLVFFRLFGKNGIYTWTVICTISANIEVLILVRAFGMDMTLGNVLFASSFLATDIMSELFGKKEASRCVWIGIASNLAFIAISQSWFLYTPAASDTLSAPIRTVFANTPRVMLASLIGYAVSELYDVWAYHALWSWSERKSGDKRRFLWLRNNGSTLVSQLINTLVFNLLAFAGFYPAATVTSIIVTGYVIYIITSLADTPFLYLARRLAERTTTLSTP